MQRIIENEGSVFTIAGHPVAISIARGKNLVAFVATGMETVEDVRRHAEIVRKRLTEGDEPDRIVDRET